MATNLRLRDDAEAAVRAEAKRSGRSQQDVIRDAIDRDLGLRDAGSGSARIRPPRREYERPGRRLRLPPERSTVELLDRDDR